MLIAYYSNVSGKEAVVENNHLRDSISIISTPDLYDLTTNWAKEYCSINPELKINVINATNTETANLLDANINLGFISDKHYASLNDEYIRKIVVGRDVIVPIINSNNPFLEDIYTQGVSSGELAKIFENPEKKKWNILLENIQDVPVNYYMINDESIKSAVANFLNINQNIIDGIKIKNVGELISTIQKDPNAIGFCKMIDIFDINNQIIVENIKLLPIDRNGNGNIDYMEEIYDDINAFKRGVWIGKYPKALYRNIYSIYSVKSTNEIEVAFLKWVLTNGQQYQNANGYCDLTYSERQTKLIKLEADQNYTTTSKGVQVIPKMLLLILLLMAISFFILDMVIRYIRRNKANVKNTSSIRPIIFDENSVSIPKGLFFDKTYSWAFMEKDGLVKIGIDDFLQHVTGPITQTKMKNNGEKITKGKQLLTIIQNGKQLNINSPISGTIIERNEALTVKASKINYSPYSDGWVYMIEPSNWLKEIQLLSMAEKYKEWLKNEFPRLKDFLAAFVKANTIENSLVFQDGGALKDGILADLGPEIWEDFQTNFINKSK